MKIGNCLNNIPNIDLPKTVSQAKAEGFSQGQIKQLTQSGKTECETCANRKYQDGSNEMVSFKAAAHIAPEAAASAVRSHEQEHVSNAYDKAIKQEGKVMQASVSISTSICPECGRTYVSGGETTTQIKYQSKNPYSQAAKVQDASILAGENTDYKV